MIIVMMTGNTEWKAAMLSNAYSDFLKKSLAALDAHHNALWTLEE